MNLRRLAHGGGFGRVQAEEFRGAEAEEAADDVGGEAHERGVVSADGVVVMGEIA